MIEPDKPVIHLRDERLTGCTECGLSTDEATTNAELMATCPKCINWRAGTLEYRAKQLRTVQREIEGLSFRLLRLSKNITLSEVAEAIGVCRSLVGKWERGELVSKRSDDMWAALKAMPSRERKYRIDIDVLRQRASDGGRAAHAKGTAHEFTYRECLKGGVRSSRKHPLGRKRAQMLNKLSQVAKKRTK